MDQAIRDQLFAEAKGAMETVHGATALADTAVTASIKALDDLRGQHPEQPDTGIDNLPTKNTTVGLFDLTVRWDGASTLSFQGKTLVRWIACDPDETRASATLRIGMSVLSHL